MLQALDGYPGYLVPNAQGDLWTLVCRGADAPLRVSVATPRELSALVTELGLHRRAPKVWTALAELTPRASDPEAPDEFRFGFLSGYLAVKAASVPPNGRFVSVSRLDVNSVLCPPHLDPDGFRHGVKAYIQGFWKTGRSTKTSTETSTETG